MSGEGQICSDGGWRDSNETERLTDERQRLGSENQTCILMAVKTVTWG